VAQVATAFVRAAFVVARIVVLAVLFGLLTHVRWYTSLEWASIVVLGVWGFEKWSIAWQEELARDSAWLTLLTLAREGQEFEKLKAAYIYGNREEVVRASQTLKAAIRNNQ
jgi:hypothetical protein